MIVLFTLLAAGIIAAVICHYTDSDLFFTLSAIGILVGGIFSAASGIVALIANSSPVCIDSRQRYEQNVKNLSTTYKILMEADDGYAKYTAIQQYNVEVKEFKTNILVKQECLKNPWINWFVCRENNNFDANAVQYIELN